MNRESERKRLIELLKLPSNCMPHSKCESCGLNGGCSVQRQADKILEDGWMRPPVKLNTFAYFFIRNEVKEGYVREITFDKGGTRIAVCYDGTYFKIFKPYDIGKTVFTSREDAVKALEGSGD